MGSPPTGSYCFNFAGADVLVMGSSFSGITRLFTAAVRAVGTTGASLVAHEHGPAFGGLHVFQDNFQAGNDRKGQDQSDHTPHPSPVSQPQEQQDRVDVQVPSGHLDLDVVDPDEAV